MTYVEQIEQLWTETGNQDLATILRQLLELLDQATSAGEDVPPALELEIILQANYALGFGGTPAEARHLAVMYHQLLELAEVHDIDQFNISSDKFHRLACTLAGAVLSLLSSDEYQQTSTVHSVPVWEDLPADSSVANILATILDHLVKGLFIGSPNNWTLELLTFIITFHLLHQDLDASGLSTATLDRLRDFLAGLDRQSMLWSNWKNSWLEYSDYYRFVTLVLTNTSSPEEIWLDELDLLL